MGICMGDRRDWRTLLIEFWSGRARCELSFAPSSASTWLSYWTHFSRWIPKPASSAASRRFRHMTLTVTSGKRKGAPWNVSSFSVVKLMERKSHHGSKIALPYWVQVNIWAAKELSSYCFAWEWELPETHGIITRECLLQAEQHERTWVKKDGGHFPQVQLEMAPLSSCFRTAAKAERELTTCLRPPPPRQVWYRRERSAVEKTSSRFQIHPRTISKGKMT